MTRTGCQRGSRNRNRCFLPLPSPFPRPVALGPLDGKRDTGRGIGRWLVDGFAMLSNYNNVNCLDPRR